MRCILSLLALVLTLAFTATPGAAAEPGLHSFTLDNGLMVVVVEDHRAPVVTQMLWYRVGSADDPAGQAGTAHFLEHLMFKGTGKLAEGEFDRTVEENGGGFDAFTSMDQTVFSERVAADRLDLVMGMEADRMANLAPSEASVASERNVIIEERRQVVDGDPSGAFREEQLAALYADSPYGRPTIGSEAEINALTRDGEMAFYRAHYAPNNAILIVAGDVEADTVREMAERHFGPIPGGTPTVRSAPAPQPKRPAPPPIEARDARIPVPQYSRFYLAPQRRAGDQKEAAALLVLADVLGGERITAIMSRDLTGAQGNALAAGASYSGTGISEQVFGVYIVPKPGVDRAEAEASLDAVIARFLEEGPDPREIERVKGRARGGLIYQLDSVSGRAGNIGNALTSGLTLEDVEAWPDVIQSVTVEDVKAAANDVFRERNSVSGWLLPGGAPQELAP